MENAILASKRDPFDPMERALHEAGDRLVKDTQHRHPAWSLVKEYPLTPDLLAVSHAWATGNEDEVVVAAKGAPEAIADLCHLGREDQEALAREVADLASEGLRVLGVARGTSTHHALPDAHRDLSLSLVGLIGFEDPLRPTVPAAVAECRTAGVRVVMIPVFFADWPLLLLPVHIVFLELIIDPSCSLIFEAEEAEADIMQRPPP